MNVVDLEAFTLCTNTVRVRRERDGVSGVLGLSCDFAEMREKH